MRDYDSMSDFDINAEVAAYDAGGRRFLQDFDSKSDVACYTSSGVHIATKNYCNNPSDAWPIILDNRIMVKPSLKNEKWWANKHENIDGYFAELHGVINENPLRAAMIVFLMMQESKDE